MAFYALGQEAVDKIFYIILYSCWGLSAVGAFLQATSRVPRWWIGERPPDMAASCDIYK